MRASLFCTDGLNRSDCPSILTSGKMANRLNIIPVRVKQKGRIIMRMIQQTQSRFAVVTSPGGQARSIKTLYLCVRGGAKGKMSPRAHRRAFRQPEITTGIGILAAVPDNSKSDCGRKIRANNVSKRAQNSLVKYPARLDVANGDAKMINHKSVPAPDATQIICVKTCLPQN